MAKDSYDLIVVGGGIGGSALATVMARHGKRVLLLEAQEAYQDRVRGEWIAPWGVIETQRVGLYDTLMAAGGHHLKRHITYDESIAPEAAEASAQPLDIFMPGVPGPLCIRHPVHCETLFVEAGKVGAEALRPVNVTKIVTGDAPEVWFTHDGVERTARAPLIVGADGRMSPVREAAGITLHQDKPHHWFAGLLVDGVENWSDDLQAIGTEGDFGFLAFPQGNGRVRVYGGYSLEERSRFTGPEGPQRFLEAFRMQSCPKNEAIANGTPAGPLFSYFNSDSWTDKPFARGVVLVGDAAGWNDPIIGLGLSITYRDVRTVTDVLKATDDYANADFSAFAEERTERMRRLRFAAGLQASLDMEFGEAAMQRRKSFHERSAADPSLKMHSVAVMAGPEHAPAEMFTEAHRARVLGA
ncbi:MAG: FAD-dependent monooxygenase [Alphaproteobacteria bacterium]|nr:FAD-dependent monooxygenase [Alphaproteobacteria bacterium]